VIVIRQLTISVNLSFFKRRGRKADAVGAELFKF